MKYPIARFTSKSEAEERANRINQGKDRKFPGKKASVRLLPITQQFVTHTIGGGNRTVKWGVYIS